MRNRHPLVNSDVRKGWTVICIFMIMISLAEVKNSAGSENVLGKNTPISDAPPTTVSINTGALVVLSAVFDRFHLPINIERAFASDMSIVIGVHPAIPMNQGVWREAFGASCRARWYFTSSHRHRLWIEGGLWGIYQRNRLGSKKRDTYREKLSDSMIGLSACFGYRHKKYGSPWIVQPFLGVALPVVVFRDRQAEIFGYPYPWAGLGIGYAF